MENAEISVETELPGRVMSRCIYSKTFALVSASSREMQKYSTWLMLNNLCPLSSQMQLLTSESQRPIYTSWASNLYTYFA